jgi:ferredoxin
MFSRRLLEIGSARYADYYSRHPGKEALDDAFRRRPGLLDADALFHDTITASAADASFTTVAAFHALLDHEKLSANREEHDPARITLFISTWLAKLGAVSSGVTELHDHHLYSTIGRGPRYGEPVELAHTHAVALTVEMDKRFLDRAPRGPTVMESAQQYLNSGAIAVQLAEFIRGLGYSARAHMDGSYRVVCPLVARDAGLGEIGRMGLLMTPELGPRVRIAVVTTDLPLLPHARDPDATMIDFCLLCKKCADACPPKAISFDDMVEIDGVPRWRINSEACFAYWCTVGTDCGRCMSVCPYSHPDTLLHNIVRRGITKSSLARRCALALDDFFYGRVPAPLAPPDWIAGAVPFASGPSRQEGPPSV